MDFLNEFNRIMEKTNDIALATAVHNNPNVRIISFCYGKPGVLYFTTFKDNPKTQEFSQNKKVAFTTIPVGNVEQVRVNNATVRKSDLPMDELKDKFIKKYPGYVMLFTQFGDKLELYEIHFKEASVTVDFNISGKISL